MSLGPSSYFDYGHTIGSAIAKRCDEEKKAAGRNIKNALFILPFDDAVGQCDIIKDLTTSSCTSIYEDELANEIDDISKSTNEQSWRMPLIESYNDQLKSSIADITNYGSKYGGSTTAGLFLQHFIKDLSSTQFAHIDIAGPCWDDTMKDGGATGYGSKLVTEWIRRQYFEDEKQK